ncbi:MAG: hypothetical protein AAGB11_07385 [Pseudomonadota bacterium]
MRTKIATAAALLVLSAVFAQAYSPEEPAELTPPVFGAPDKREGPVPALEPVGEPDALEDEPGDHSAGEGATGVPPARASLADVSYGRAGLPSAVATARDALLAAARSGDIEALRPIFATQQVAPLVTPMDAVDDPVEHLRLQSGDPEGREILAIMVELLEAGHVAVDGRTTTYVWPYFAEVSLDDLQPAHEVELYRILTAIDVEEMERLGRYTFFRIGIAEDGRIRYFSAGEVE